MFVFVVFAPLIPFIGQRAVLGLSGYVLNNLAFVLASFYLYRLSAIILKDSEVALRPTILFCLNPASIFYSTMYFLLSCLAFASYYDDLHMSIFCCLFTDILRVCMLCVPLEDCIIS